MEVAAGGAEDEYTRVSVSICAIGGSAELYQVTGTAAAAAEAEAAAAAEAVAEAEAGLSLDPGKLQKSEKIPVI